MMTLPPLPHIAPACSRAVVQNCSRVDTLAITVALLIVLGLGFETLTLQPDILFLLCFSWPLLTLFNCPLRVGYGIVVLLSIVSTSTIWYLDSMYSTGYLLDAIQCSVGLIFGTCARIAWEARYKQFHPTAITLLPIVGVLLAARFASGSFDPPRWNGLLEAALICLSCASVVAIPRSIPKALCIGLGLCTALLFVTQSKTGSLAVLFALPVWATIHGRIWGMALIFPLVVAFFLFTMWIAVPSRLLDLVVMEESHSSLSRLALAQAGISAAINNPLLGLGPQGMNVADSFSRYYSDDLLTHLIATGVTRSHADTFGSDLTSGTHNAFVDLASSYGLIFFFLFSVLMVRGILRDTNARRRFEAGFGIGALVLAMSWQYSTAAYGMALFSFVMASPVPRPSFPNVFCHR